MSNARDAAAANLALLIRDLEAAGDDANKKQAAMDALDAFSENTPFTNLGTIATAASATANAALRQDAIDGMAKALTGISDLRSALKTAQTIAQNSEQHLIFPRLAATLGQVEMMLTTLKEQFDALQKAQIDTLKDGVDLDRLAAVAGSVEAAVTAIKQKVEAAKE